MNVDDVMFLLGAGEVDEHLATLLRHLSVDVSGLRDEEVDELRDLAGEILQIRGFEEDYSVTPAGQRLERIIDDLYRS